MELKLSRKIYFYIKNLCSNRTFMELKYKQAAEEEASIMRSNRTFMELKC